MASLAGCNTANMKKLWTTLSQISWRHAALAALTLLLAACAAARPLELGDVRTETPVGAVELFDDTGHPINAQLPLFAGTVKPEVNILVLSGGGADGAFGAGVLVGWAESGLRPVFDIVTGVSTGALMATLVFLGAEYDPVLKDVYTTVSSDDIYRKKGLKGVFSDSLLDYTPLKDKIESLVTEELLERVAREHHAGRRLYVATTNLDSGEVVVWDMGYIAASGHPDRVKIYQKVLLASAAVPGLFQPVYIRPSESTEARQMHVDGGVKSPVLLRAFMLKQPAARRNVYVIVNSHMKLLNADKAVEPEVLDISRKSITELLRGLLQRTVYQAYVTSRQSKASFNLISIPDHAPSAKDGLTFEPAVMKRQFELGRDFGRAGGGWMSEPPRLEDLERING